MELVAGLHVERAVAWAVVPVVGRPQVQGPGNRGVVIPAAVIPSEEVGTAPGFPGTTDY